MLHVNVLNPNSTVYQSDTQSVLAISLNILQLIFCGFLVTFLAVVGSIGNIVSIFGLEKIPEKQFLDESFKCRFILKCVLVCETILVLCLGFSIGVPTLLTYNPDFRNASALKGTSVLVYNNLVEKYFEIVPVSLLYFIGSSVFTALPYLYFLILQIKYPKENETDFREPSESSKNNYCTRQICMLSIVLIACLLLNFIFVILFHFSSSFPSISNTLLHDCQCSVLWNHLVISFVVTTGFLFLYIKDVLSTLDEQTLRELGISGQEYNQVTPIDGVMSTSSISAINFIWNFMASLAYFSATFSRTKSCDLWYEAEIWAYFFMVLGCSIKFPIFWVNSKAFRNAFSGYKDHIPEVVEL